MATNKIINTAGIFILGQSHKDHISFSKSMKRKDLHSSSNSTADSNDDQNSSKFDEKHSFVGRLFNFNVWNEVKSNEFIMNLYSDCKLIYCGTATQWSDFRQGTRGNVKMRWPTELIWTSLCSFFDLITFFYFIFSFFLSIYKKRRLLKRGLSIQ